MSYTVTVNTTIANPGNVVNSIGFASNDTAQAGQSFTTVAAGNVTSLDVKGGRDGSDASLQYYFQIMADSSSTPSNSSLGESTNTVVLNDFPALVSFSCFATAPSAVTFTFGTPVAVSAATRYWAIMTTKGVYGTPDRGVRWCGDSASAHSEILKATTSSTTTWGSAVATSAGYLVVTIQTVSDNGEPYIYKIVSPINLQKPTCVIGTK